MVFDYSKYDLEQILKCHKSEMKVPDDRGQLVTLPPRMDRATIKSILYQILRGLHYLHSNWIIHRDLKPANILLSDNEHERGVVKIADFGLARVIAEPLRTLGDDGPVVTIWYRAPELILGAKHYTPAVDMWAVGCIFNELVMSRPMFEGKEVRVEGNQNPFQEHQLETIFRILGTPTLQDWPTMKYLVEYPRVEKMQKYPNRLEQYTYLDKTKPEFDLLKRLLAYDPEKRITAAEALKHPYFQEQPKPSRFCFAGYRPYRYPEHSIRPENYPPKSTGNQSQQQQQSRHHRSSSQPSSSRHRQIPQQPYQQSRGTKRSASQKSAPVSTQKPYKRRR